MDIEMMKAKADRVAQKVGFHAAEYGILTSKYITVSGGFL